MEDNNRNAFIDDGGLSKSTSLTHLLNENDNMDSDNIEVIEHSSYYSDADFQSLLKLNNTLSIMSLNSQSINAKFDEIQLFIDIINTSGSLGILCLQESWTDINEDISLFELPGYTLHHQGKQCCKHGGLFVYVHNRYKVEPLNINFQSTKWEGYCLKVSQTHPYLKHYVIANLYRPPYETIDDFNLFNAEFDTFVSKISEMGYPSYICGDLNIKLLTLSDPGYFRQLTIRGGGALNPPPPYDLENYCVNLHHIIHVNFTRCFWHDPIGIFQKFGILTILQRFQNKK